MKCLEFWVCLVVLPIIQIRKVTWSSMPLQAAVCGRRPCGYGFGMSQNSAPKNSKFFQLKHLDLRDTGTNGNLERFHFLKHSAARFRFRKRTRFFVRPVGGAWCAWLHAGLSNYARWGGPHLGFIGIELPALNPWGVCEFCHFGLCTRKQVDAGAELNGEIGWDVLWPTKRGLLFHRSVWCNQAIQFLDEGQLATQQLLFYTVHTLPETSSLHQKIDDWKMIPFWVPAYFQGRKCLC